MRTWYWWADIFLVTFLVLMPVSATVGPAALNVQWSDLAAGGFFISCVAGSGRRSRGGSAFTALLGWACVYLASQLPSFLHTAHPMASWVEWVKTAYVVGLGVTITAWVREVAAWDRVTQVFAIVVGVMLLVSLSVWSYARWSGHVPANLAVAMGVPNVGQVVRMKATFFTPAMLANYLTMGLPVLAAYAATRARWPRAVCWGLLLLGVLATATTASHSLAGCLVAAAMMAPRTTRWDRLGRAGVWMLAAATIIFGLVSTTVSIYGVETTRAQAALPPRVACEHDFLGAHGTGEELTIRIHYGQVVYGLLKRFAWEAWHRSPWVGIGLGEFPHVVVEAFRQGRVHARYQEGCDPHNTWLGAMAEGGLIGVAGLIALWAFVIRYSLKALAQHRGNRDRWRLQAPLAGLAGLLVNSVHVDVMHFRFLWVGIALLLAAAMRRSEEPRDAGRGVA